MTTAAEVFVLQLSKASRRAMRFLHARGLNADERDEVIATAILWCWENRHKYSLTTTLETWMINAIQNAFRSWVRGEIRNSGAALEAALPPDPTERSAEVVSSAKAIIAALPYEYRRVLWLQVYGYSWKEIERRGISQRTVREVSERLKQLRHLLPSQEQYKDALLTVPLPGAPDEPDVDEVTDEPEESTTSASTELGNWVHQQIVREVNGLGLYGPLETYYSKVREMLNKRAGLEISFMPAYIPPKHWRS